MKKASMIFALIAMMLFAYGCGKEDSSSKGKETTCGTGDTCPPEEIPDTGDDEETPDTGDDVTHTDTGLAMTTYKYARAYCFITIKDSGGYFR